MNTNKRIDPELLPMLEFFPELELSLETINETREQMAQMLETVRAQLPPVEGVTSEDRQVPGPEGDPDIMVRIYKPEGLSGELPGLFWMHGGGYVMGSIEGEDLARRQAAKDIGCVIVSVDYRLAPEHPYPEPIEDCYAAFKWMFENAGDLGVDNSRIAVGGGSAGGGLAAGLTLLVRDRAEVEIVFQLLIYPMIDDSNIIPAGDNTLDTLIWSRASNLFGWTSYLGGPPGGEGVSPYAAAYRATDLSGLPPAFMAVGDMDLFVNEDIEYANRLIKAGVPTELHVYPGAIHGFNAFATNTNVAQICNKASRRALKAALKG